MFRRIHSRALGQSNRGYRYRMIMLVLGDENLVPILSFKFRQFLPDIFEVISSEFLPAIGIDHLQAFDQHTCSERCVCVEVAG